MRVNTEAVPAEIRAELEAQGRAWANQEFDLAREFERERDDWTLGAWCGDTSQLDAIRDDSEENDSNQSVVEQVIDDAAKEAWDAAWDAKEAAQTAE